MDATTDLREAAQLKAKLFAPIARYGAIVSATLDRGRVAFRYAKLNDAISAVEATREDYMNAGIQFLEADRWSVTRPGLPHGNWPGV